MSCDSLAVHSDMSFTKPSDSASSMKSSHLIPSRSSNNVLSVSLAAFTPYSMLVKSSSIHHPTSPSMPLTAVLLLRCLWARLCLMFAPNPTSCHSVFRWLVRLHVLCWYDTRFSFTDCPEPLLGDFCFAFCSVFWCCSNVAYCLGLII